jgi:hypothetical protein
VYSTKFSSALSRYQRSQSGKNEETSTDRYLILVIAILAVIAGAQGWEDMENYGISKQPWLAEFLELPNGIPSDDTFRRVFEFINPRELNCCFFQ